MRLRQSASEVGLMVWVVEGYNRRPGGKSAGIPGECPKRLERGA